MQRCRAIFPVRLALREPFSRPRDLPDLLEFAYENAGQAGSLGRAGGIGPIDLLLRIAEVGESGHISMQALRFQISAEPGQVCAVIRKQKDVFSPA